jgi:hypothetical protein
LKTGDFEELRDVYGKIRKNRKLSVVADGSHINFS